MNKLIPYLRSATALPGYRLRLGFEDGTTGVIDLSSWKGKGVFSYWNDENNFKAFNITGNRKLEWNDDIDMDPDAFYLKLVGKSFEEYAGDKQLYGILIKMYFGDHVPPHFHAEYAEFSAQVSIYNFAIIEGYLPPKALALVMEWASVHQEALIENWQSLSENGTGTFKKIEPLK